MSRGTILLVLAVIAAWVDAWRPEGPQPLLGLFNRLAWSRLEPIQTKLQSQVRARMQWLQRRQLQVREELGGLRQRLGERFGREMSEAGSEATTVDAAYAFVMEATSSDGHWELKVDGPVRVWRAKVDGSPVCAVRANGIIEAPPSAVIALLKRGDAETIRTYNPLYDSGHDVVRLDQRTKLSYARVRRVFPLKPRDSLTRVSEWDLPRMGAGASALLLRAATHPDAPSEPGYVRARILKGMHLVQPIHGQPGRSNFTTVTQARRTFPSLLLTCPECPTNRQKPIHLFLIVRVRLFRWTQVGWFLPF